MSFRILQLGAVIAFAIVPALGQSPPPQGRGGFFVVRVVNANTGHGLPGAAVAAKFFLQGGAAVSGFDGVYRTDASGTARVGIPPATEDLTLISIETPRGHWFCLCSFSGHIAEVLASGGTVADGTGRRPKDSISRASPGEVIFLARPIGLAFRVFAWLLGPLERS